MSYVEMLKELLEIDDIKTLGRALGMSPQKLENIIKGVEEVKKHHASNIKGHYEMKKRVKAFSERMKAFSL